MGLTNGMTIRLGGISRGRLGKVMAPEDAQKLHSGIGYAVNCSEGSGFFGIRNPQSEIDLVSLLAG